jgi:hypothetical protein
MSSIRVRQAVLSDLEELAALFNQYRQALYQALGWSQDRQFHMFHRCPGVRREA